MNCPGLDLHKLEALMLVIHKRPTFRNMDKEEFAANAKPRIEQSLPQAKWQEDIVPLLH